MKAIHFSSSRYFRSLATVIVAGFVLVGCTSTRIYDLSNTSDRAEVGNQRRVEIRMDDGTRFTATELRVDGDSLSFLVEPDRDQLEVIAVSDVTRVAVYKDKPAGTLALVAAVPAVIFGALVIACWNTEGCGGD